MSLLLAAANLVPTNTSDVHWPSCSLNVARGDVVCLLGTDHPQLDQYLRTLIGVTSFSSGELKLLGQDTSQIAEKDWQSFRTQIAYISRETPLLSVLSALNNVVFPALYHGTCSRDEALTEAERILSQLNFTENVEALPAYLTPLGRVQTAIARAVILKPQMLVLADPWYSIDPHEYDVFLPFFHHWKTQGALITASQNLDFVKHHATKIMFLGTTEIESFASWKALCNSKNPFIQDYLRRHTEPMQGQQGNL